MLIDLFGMRKYDYDKAEARFRDGERITFWDLYKQALIVGEYSEWREKCFIAARQGMRESAMYNANDLAFFTRIAALIVIPLTLIALAQFFAWLATVVL